MKYVRWSLILALPASMAAGDGWIEGVMALFSSIGGTGDEEMRRRLDGGGDTAPPRWRRRMWLGSIVDVVKWK